MHSWEVFGEEYSRGSVRKESYLGKVFFSVEDTLENRPVFQPFLVICSLLDCHCCSTLSKRRREVIAMEDWVTIKTLKSKNPKLSYREIARLIGVSHHTVKTALERDGPPCYQGAVAPHPHLDLFREVRDCVISVQCSLTKTIAEATATQRFKSLVAVRLVALKG